MNSDTTPSIPALSLRNRILSRSTPARAPRVFQLGSLLGAVTISMLTLSSTTGQRAAFCLALIGIFFITLMRAPTTSIVLFAIFLAVIGGVRRWLIPVLDYVPNDPLLLIVPIVLFLYASIMFIQRRFVLNTPLSRCICWLLVLMILEIVNPLQGGLLVGAAGSLFYIVPILWYFVGRQMGTLFLLRRLYIVCIPIAIAGIAYGLKQMWFGLADSEVEWMRQTKWNQVFNNGIERTFSFFTNGGEYTMAIGTAIVLLWVAFLRGKRLALLLIPPLIAALFLGSYRSSVVATLLACTVIWAVQGRTMRSWLPRGAFALFIGIVGISWSLQQASQLTLDKGAQTALQHQTKGLLDPSNSTASVHSTMLTNGILSSFSTPWGHGLGSTTLAGTKFGDTGVSSEFDISDMFLSLGPIGGILYLFVMVSIFRMVFRYWMRTRSSLALCDIGILFLFVGHWLRAGLLGSMIVWFSIGVLDRANHILDQEDGSTDLKGKQGHGTAHPQERSI